MQSLLVHLSIRKKKKEKYQIYQQKKEKQNLILMI